MAAPLSHDTPDAMTMAHGDVSRLPGGWVPGVTMPKLVPVVRDYTQIRNKFDAIGPLAETAGLPTKGIMLIPDEEMTKLARAHGTGRGAAEGHPQTYFRLSGLSIKSSYVIISCTQERRNARNV